MARATLQSDLARAEQARVVERHLQEQRRLLEQQNQVEARASARVLARLAEERKRSHTSKVDALLREEHLKTGGDENASSNRGVAAGGDYAASGASVLGDVLDQAAQSEGALRHAFRSLSLTPARASSRIHQPR